MIVQQSQAYEYQITIINVKMKVKFPCRMKIEQAGSLLTGEIPPSDDNRYIFNQAVTLKDPSNKQCFELTANLLTDKGAKYIAGVIKLYQSQLIRSEGERLVLSLSKCIDNEAFCQIKVDQVVVHKSAKNIPYDRKSTLQRDVPYRKKDVLEMDFSPSRSAYKARVQESKSEYQFPLNKGPNEARPDWDVKSKSRYMPQTVYQKSRIQQRPNYVNNQPIGFQMAGDIGSVGRQKMLEAEVYKQGYQKLKEKYKKQTELSKQQLNKRLALQNNQNNLKLEIMRLKLKAEENEKSLTDKTSKLKELQIQLSSMQQRQSDNAYLREQNNKKQGTIRMLEDKVRTLSRNIEEIRDLSEQKSINDGNRIKELQQEINNLKLRFQSRQAELEKESKLRLEQLHQKQLELLSKTDILEREKKTVSDLQKSLQNKQFQLEKLLQTERNNSKIRQSDQKAKIQKQQRQLLLLQEQKKQLGKQLQTLKTGLIRVDYEKKLTNQELQSIKIQYLQLKAYKQKYLEINRENKSILQQKSHIEKQLEKTIHSKDTNLTEINKQFQDQLQYQRKINRQLDQKLKALNNKLMETEGQLDLSRSQQDKIRRNLEASIREASDAKEKEKTARKALKTKEQEMLSMETEQATMKQKLKNVDQIYKLEADKHREQVDKIRIQLENEFQRNEDLQESNNSFNMELNKLKIKLQYAEERTDKDTQNLKEKQNQIEGLIKDYEQQISGLDQTLNSLRNSEKELIAKNQKNEMELIKTEQKWQRAKKDIKVLEERCNNNENIIKAKTSDIQSLQAIKDTLQKRVNQLQLELNDLQTTHLTVTNQKGKTAKIAEIVQEQLKKAKGEIVNLTSSLAGKEKQIEELRNQIKTQKEEGVKFDLKYNNYKKQIDRNKEALFDVIQKSLYTLPLGIKEDSRKNVDLLLNKKPVENTFAEYYTMITSHAKEVKQSLVKQMDLIKQLEREKQRLQEEVSSSSNKYQNTQLILKKQIQQLQTELQQVIEEKQQELANHSETVESMDERIKEFQLVVEELNNQIEELNFTNNSLKMDYEVINQQNIKKINNLKKVNSELEEKVEYQTSVIADMDERCSTLENNAELLQTTIDNEGQAHQRKDKLIEQLKDQINSHERMIEELKKNKKQLLERVSELELYLQTQKELNQKNKQMLAEEQAKASELKTFISSMMKQKEVAIQNDLERREALSTLQANLLEVSQNLQLSQEENSKNIKALEQQKEINKKLSATIKQLQSDKKQDKTRYSKMQELLRQKERDMLNKDQTIKKYELKYERTVEKMKSQLKDIQEELDNKSTLNIEQARDTSDKIFQLENELQKKNASLNELNNKLLEAQEQLFSEREKIILLEEAHSKVKAEQEELKMRIHEMDSNLNEINDQTKLKEQQLFDFSGKNYNLERKLEYKQQEHLQEMEYLDNDWREKYDSMYEEYEQRLQLIEKERNYFKTLGEDKDKEISKLNQIIRSNEQQENNTRKIYEDKIKKSEEDKLAILSGKNIDLQRQAEENKTLSESLKTREGEIRKLTNQLEVARKTIANLDQKSKDYDQKLKGVNKLYQAEMEQLKKRDVSFKTYKEQVINYLWTTEREIKKGLQNFIKNFLEVSQDKNSPKIVEMTRNLQKTIMDTLAIKPQEK